MVSCSMAWLGLGLGLDLELTVVRLCIEFSKIVADGDVICIVVLYLCHWMAVVKLWSLAATCIRQSQKSRGVSDEYIETQSNRV